MIVIASRAWLIAELLDGHAYGPHAEGLWRRRAGEWERAVDVVDVVHASSII
jgi:hypothetical protein